MIDSSDFNCELGEKGVIESCSVKGGAG